MASGLYFFCQIRTVYRLFRLHSRQKTLRNISWPVFSTLLVYYQTFCPAPHDCETFNRSKTISTFCLFQLRTVLLTEKYKIPNMVTHVWYLILRILRIIEFKVRSWMSLLSNNWRKTSIDGFAHVWSRVSFSPPLSPCLYLPYFPPPPNLLMWDKLDKC